MTDRTFTVEYDGTKTVLARATIADARVRRALVKALDKYKDDWGLGTFCYYMTQLVSTDASSDRKLTVCPDDSTVEELYLAWCERTDEVFSSLLAAAITQLIQVPGEKKASETSSSVTPVAEKTPNPVTTTPHNP